MGRILIIEDDGVLAERISDNLSNFDIEEAYSYITAIDAWEEHEGDYKCIILDLDIPPDGLDDDQLKNDYHGICGILLLNAFCENQSPEKQREIWAKTVIYSAFNDELDGKEIMQNPPGIPHKITKQAINSISKLVKVVKEISNQSR